MEPLDDRPGFLVDIIIRGKNGHEKTARAIASIRQNTAPETYRLILVDDGSDPPYHDSLEDIGDTIVAWPESAGAVTATNAGFAIALDSPAPLVMVMDNDAWVPTGDSDWLLRFAQELTEFDSTGVVGATTNYANPPQHCLRTPDTYTADWGERVPGKKFGVRENPPCVSLVSFACLIRKDVLRATGGRWDTRYDPGNFEDSDFAVQVRLAGFDVRVARSVYLHHDGHSTFSDDLKLLLKTNQRRFVDKWGMGRLMDLGFVTRDEMAQALTGRPTQTTGNMRTVK